MGAQQVLRAAVCITTISGPTAYAAPGSRAREHVVVIDLGPGPDDQAVRHALSAAVVAAGLEPGSEPLDAALAGNEVDRDAIVLAARMSDAERAFGQLDCTKTVANAAAVLPILAARQAGGIAVPELPRATAYLLLCADRAGDPDAAMRAASRLRTAGGSPDVAPALLSKYPEIDAAGGDLVDVDVSAEVPGTQLWVDFHPASPASSHLVLTATEHVIAAAAGSRRGALIGTPIVSQPHLIVPMPDQAGEWSAVAARVSGWHGTLPSPDELAWVLGKVHARAALVRHGDVVEAWGHAGLAEPMRRLGGDDGVRALADADKAAALIADRVETWNAHAPDPDQPLLVESLHDRAAKLAGHHEPTRWWVYAAIGAAAVAAAAIVFAHYEDTDTQRVELHFP